MAGRQQETIFNCDAMQFITDPARKLDAVYIKDENNDYPVAIKSKVDIAFSLKLYHLLFHTMIIVSHLLSCCFKTKLKIFH